MFKEKNVGKKTVNDKINTKKLSFSKLSDHAGESIRIWGYFFTNGDYGKQLVLVSENSLINVPNRYVTDFEEWNDYEREVIVNGGLVIENIREITTKNARKTWAFDYNDYENPF